MENEEVNIEATTPEPELSLRQELEAATEVVEKADRARDEAGRFAAAKAEAQEVEVEVKEKPATEAPPAQQQVEPATNERPTLAPNTWSTAAKAAWVNADPVLKAEISKREADVHREFTRQDGERNLGKQFRQVIEPHAAMIQQDGGNPVKGFQNYLETARILRGNDAQMKATLVRQMCQQFNIDLNAQPVAQNYQQAYTPPQQPAIDRQQLEAEIRGNLTLQAKIDAFAADPKNEHFEAVKPAMVALLSGGMASNLEEAYEGALWVRPDIRSSLIARETKAVQDQRVAQAKAKADAARRAGGSVTGSPGIGQQSDPQAGTRTLRQELEANFASNRV